MISKENFNYSYYISGPNSAQISINMSPDDTFITYSVIELINWSELKNNFSFNSIEAAIQHINYRYGHWNFITQSAKPCNKSCETCPKKA